MFGFLRLDLFCASVAIAIVDILFPPVEQELLAAYIPNAQLAIIDSHYGHDGFLLEMESITQEIEKFFEKQGIPQGSPSVY